MGKGGNSNSNGQAKKKAIAYSLEKLETEELRKWGKAYNVKLDDRVALLEGLEPFAGGILDKDRPANLPLEKPTFTLETIRKAIPDHCFKRNLLTSLSHLISDLAIIGLLFYASTFISTSSLPPWSHYVLWPIYWYAQGSVMTGVWVLAHECGHQSFSESEFWNNFFGTILHSLLLVPYHSWRITHGRHHNNTGSCENDEVFAPATRSDWAKEMLRETPIAQLWGIFVMLTFGWMPGYLVFNAAGPKKYKGKNANHFSPSAVFFKEDEYFLIVQTDIMFFACVALLSYCIYTFGWGAVAYYYLIPYAVTNAHLVLITYLQHTDVFMPHFREKEWSWLRGALCTVDRSFGPILDHTFHHITDTHVCHHLFSKMPFYHAQEATEAIRKVLGPYYMKDNTPILKATYRAFSNCQVIQYIFYFIVNLSLSLN